MDDAWFTEVSDELGRCLTDARGCAEACEELLAFVAPFPDDELRRSVVDAVVGAAAVSRVLFELVDQPRPLVLAAAKLCRETSEEAAGKLDALHRRLDTHAAIAALRRCADSCELLLGA